MIVFDCVTTTPTFCKAFMSKPYTNAEIRAPSLKGIIRYWWRALHPMKVKDLHRKETNLFGGMAGNSLKSSKMLIHVKMGSYAQTPQSPVPSKNFVSNAVEKDVEFKIHLRFRKPVSDCDTEDVRDKFNKMVKELTNLTKIAISLGGVGQRARRGMGSLHILRENDSDCAPIFEIDDVFSLLKKTGVNSATIDNNSSFETIRFPNQKYNYPYLRKIVFGSKIDITELDRLLWLVGHIGKKQRIHPNSLGSAQPRFASPIWVKVLKNDTQIRPVFSIFNSTKSDSSNKFDGDVNKFIKGIEEGLKEN